MDLPMNALTLPDIAAQAARQALPLEWVGMCGIALPVLFDGQRLVATADAGVSLTMEKHAASTCRVFIWRWNNWNRKRSRPLFYSECYSVFSTATEGFPAAHR
jgi:hypothetical protein